MGQARGRPFYFLKEIDLDDARRALDRCRHASWWRETRVEAAVAADKVSEELRFIFVRAQRRVCGCTGRLELIITVPELSWPIHPASQDDLAAETAVLAHRQATHLERHPCDSCLMEGWHGVHWARDVDVDVDNVGEGEQVGERKEVGR